MERLSELSARCAPVFDAFQTTAAGGTAPKTRTCGITSRQEILAGIDFKLFKCYLDV